LIFAGSKHRKDRFFKGEQAFTMLKHGFAALMILHDAETPLCSTVYFSDAETPLKNTGDHFPDAETSLIDTFISSQSQKHPIPPSFSLPKQLCPALVSLFPSSAATPFATTFPVAETPIVSNFPSVSPMLKHHCSAFFHPFPSSFSPPIIDETIPSSNCFASFCAETPLFSISHPLPIIFFTPLIDETIPSSNCFVSLLKHHHSAHYSSMLLKHHFPATFPSFIHNAETPSFSTL
jgi:hypothetical protein